MTAQPELHYVGYDAFLALTQGLANAIAASGWRPGFIIGVGRGGLVPAVYVSHRLDLPTLSIDHSAKLPGFADELLAKVAAMSAAGTRLLFVDDINDSGGTLDDIRKRLSAEGANLANIRFAVLINNVRSRTRVDLWSQIIDRAEDKRWFVFPWEAVGERDAIVAEARSVPERLG